MKWELPKVGDRRINEGFLWLPLTINYVRKWLEYAKWEEKYKCMAASDGTPFEMWKPVRWIEDGQ